MSKIILEQLKRKLGFSLEEFIKTSRCQLLFYTEKRKKYSYSSCFNKKQYSLFESNYLKGNCYSTSIFSIKSSKIHILQHVSGKKVKKMKSVPVLKKNIEFSNILKKIRGGFLLNLLGGISFISSSFYKEKLTYIGKNVYLELIKLKIVKYEDKFLLNTLVTRKPVTFKLKALLKSLLEKSLVYTLFSGKQKNRKCLQIFCRHSRTLKVEVIKETVLFL